MSPLHDLLLEVRASDLTYREKEVKKVLDRVTVELEGNHSARFTKLGKNYIKVQRALEILQKKRDEQNEQIKEFSEALFDQADETLTRVVETVQLTLTLSKKGKTEAVPASEVKTIDMEKLVDELNEMVPELADMIKALTEKYTTIKQIPAIPSKEIVQKLTVKMRTKSDDKIEESFSDEAKGFWKQIKSLFKNWLTSFKAEGKKYDSRLKALKKQVAAI